MPNDDPGTKKGFEGAESVDEARSATSQNEPAKKLSFLRRSLHNERGGETQQKSVVRVVLSNIGTQVG